MRAIFISLLAAATALTVAGCAGSRPAAAPPQIAQADAKPSPVTGLCKSPDAPPADVAHEPGYQQFNVSVTDSSGRPIPGLTQQDFALYAGSQTFPVAYFREDKNDEPIAIALVVDVSGSMTPKLPIVRQSLGDLVINLNRCDEVILYAFNTRTHLLMPFSTDHQMTASKMEQFRAYGQTALFDATNTALQNLEGADYPNRTIILITDGLDNSSSATEKEVAAQATKDGVPIYAVGIGDRNALGNPDLSLGPFLLGGSDEDRVDAESLKDLSAAAGGRSFIVPGTGEDGGKSFKTAVLAIADNIASGYTIGAVLPDGVTPSAVKMTVVKRLDLDVRARPIAASP
ncbi:MAG TPA: VWA domain-containing protein [Candidatus Limnocylindrales bacterium]|nr:VWA domain-containing protein [Candidatus Limnocylindrales bacterium]